MKPDDLTIKALDYRISLQQDRWDRIGDRCAARVISSPESDRDIMPNVFRYLPLFMEKPGDINQFSNSSVTYYACSLCVCPSYGIVKG